MHDCKDLAFSLFGYNFYYELMIDSTAATIPMLFPCFPKWELLHSIDDHNETLTDTKKDTVVRKFDLGSDNSSDTIIRCIIAHLSQQVFNAANDLELMHVKYVK